MSISCAVLFLSLFLANSGVNAHGAVNRVVADGVTNMGPNVYYAGDALNAQTAVRVGYQSDESKGRAFIVPSQFGDRQAMACGPSSASPAPHVLKVAAGSSVTLSWEGSTGELEGYSRNPGFKPYVHGTGPIIDYLTAVDDATKADVSDAGWVKVQEFGIDMSQTIDPELKRLLDGKPETYHPASGPGLWAAAKMIQDGSSWTLNVPKSLKAGQYIWRSEMLNMHTANAAQSYIACIQLDVTGGGSSTIQGGTKAYSLYPTSAFSDFNLYVDNPANFKVPGPALYKFDSSSAAPAPAPSPEPKPAPKEEKPAPKEEKAPEPEYKPEPEPEVKETPKAPQRVAKVEKPEEEVVEEPAQETSISVPARHKARPTSSTSMAKEVKAAKTASSAPAANTSKYVIVEAASSASKVQIFSATSLALSALALWLL